jgi:hypothetical protein
VIRADQPGGGRGLSPVALMRWQKEVLLSVGIVTDIPRKAKHFINKKANIFSLSNAQT